MQRTQNKDSLWGTWDDYMGKCKVEGSLMNQGINARDAGLRQGTMQAAGDAYQKLAVAHSSQGGAR